MFIVTECAALSSWIFLSYDFFYTELISNKFLLLKKTEKFVATINYANSTFNIENSDQAVPSRTELSELGLLCFLKLKKHYM